MGNADILLKPKGAKQTLKPFHKPSSSPSKPAPQPKKVKQDKNISEEDEDSESPEAQDRAAQEKLKAVDQMYQKTHQESDNVKQMTANPGKIQGNTGEPLKKGEDFKPIASNQLVDDGHDIYSGTGLNEASTERNAEDDEGKLLPKAGGQQVRRPEPEDDDDVEADHDA